MNVVQPSSLNRQDVHPTNQIRLLYIISSIKIAEIDESEFSLEVEDFVGFTAPSLPHWMQKTV